MNKKARGRFAPTPSGPLHLGSLLTALASFLDARAYGGRWQLRIDDLDAARCPAGAADRILEQLRAHGLAWDGEIRFQSRHRPDYAAAAERLRGRCYPCACTRATLRRSSRPGPDGPVYTGTCRRTPTQSRPAALRIRVGDGGWQLEDRWQGLQRRDLQREVGDFVLRRADGQTGYQLACVVDEAAQGITRVVRGADLLGSSLRQHWLQDALELAQPEYAHLPVLVGSDGRKLSKQNHAAPAEPADARGNLRRCLAWLGQDLPAVDDAAAIPGVIRWATEHWREAAVPRAASIVVG